MLAAIDSILKKLALENIDGVKMKTYSMPLRAVSIYRKGRRVLKLGTLEP